MELIDSCISVYDTEVNGLKKVKYELKKIGNKNFVLFADGIPEIQFDKISDGKDLLNRLRKHQVESKPKITKPKITKQKKGADTMARAKKRSTKKAKAKSGALHLVKMSGWGKKKNTRYVKKIKKGVYMYAIKG